MAVISRAAQAAVAKAASAPGSSSSIEANDEPVPKQKCPDVVSGKSASAESGQPAVYLPCQCVTLEAALRFPHFLPKPKWIQGLTSPENLRVSKEVVARHGGTPNDPEFLRKVNWRNVITGERITIYEFPPSYFNRESP